MSYSFHTIYFEATRRCNLACALCMTSSNRLDLVRQGVRRELSADEIEARVLAAGREIGAKVVSWSGGEFLLRSDASELLRRAARHGYESSICTNATVATRRRLLEMQEASGGTLVIAVGINSIEDENSWTRDSECAGAMGVLELCAELGIKRHVVVNVGRHNLATIARTLQWLEDRGIPYNRSPFTARGSGREYFAAQCVSAKEMEERLHPELRKHANGYISYTPFFLSPELHERISGGKKNVTAPQNPSIGCWIGTWIAINAEGEVAPCGILLDTLRCGNVRDKSLRQIVDDSPVFQELLDRDNLRGRCGRCRYKRTCGGCRAMAYYTHGDLLGDDPTCFFEPENEAAVCEHEHETNRQFKRYAFMARHAGRLNLDDRNQGHAAPPSRKGAD